MSIDRTAYNALVDDDGSNLVGSIWNKNAIKTVLLDPIDAQLATLVQPARVVVPYNAANFGATGGSWTVTAGNITDFSYLVSGKLLHVTFYATSTTIGGTPSALTVAIPGGFYPAVTGIYPAVTFADAIGGAMGYVAVNGGNASLGLQKGMFGAPTWPAGSLHISWTIVLPIL